MRTRPIVSLLSCLLAAPALAAAGDEQKTAAYFEEIANSPPALRVFLQAMPKGGDLHNHIGGSTYAEDIIGWAGEAGLCVDADNRVVVPPCDKAGLTPLSGLPTRDYRRYSQIIDSFSSRGFEAGVNPPTLPGQDRFFFTFDYFAAARGNTARMMATVREQAAYDRVSYIELIMLPQAARDLVAAASGVPGNGTDFDGMMKAMGPLMERTIAAARAEFDGYESEVRAAEKCGSADASSACKVQIRYQVGALSNQTPATFFSQMALGFALAKADPRFINVNIITPEHEPVPIRDYDLHMAMYAYFHARHPDMPLSLHAGELALGLVAPRDLRNHIRKAIEVAGASRIGHGVDIALETDAKGLLERMARDRIAVEINLSSNAIILGVKGRDHPLSLYRSFGVPFVISTDDEGTARSDMTNEYMRAVEEQGLRYRDLKQAARSSLQFAFIQGRSLWTDKVGGTMSDGCVPGTALPVGRCKALLDASPKAALQWALESDLGSFEAVDHRPAS